MGKYDYLLNMIKEIFFSPEVSIMLKGKTIEIFLSKNHMQNKYDCYHNYYIKLCWIKEPMHSLTKKKLEMWNETKELKLLLSK